MGSTSPLSPTFQGHIASTQDALLLFEACLTGALNHVARRPHDRERASLIKSGNVFIYEEHSSGIKRWTDGVPWSPSRILGNFLVYRELERPFPPGEKKRAMKRNKRSPGISKASDPFGRPTSGMSNGYGGQTTPGYEQSGSLSKETERSLIGSLVDSYGFKEDGLVKKTVSVTVGGVSHHLVSYYTVADVMSNKFSNPSKDPRFQHITPRPDLVTKQNFRTPIDEVDSMDRMDERSIYGGYPYARNGYDMTNKTMAHRPMSLPTPPMTYGQQTPTNLFSNNYTMNVSSGQYSEGLPSSAPSYTGQFAPSPGLYSAPKADQFDHHFGMYRQQRYNSMSGLSDNSRPSATFSRRSSNYGPGSVDSGIAGISPMDPKMGTDPTYASHNFYGALRDQTNSSSYPAQRSLPTPTLQTTYDRPITQHYSAESSPSKETMWPMGNSSAGHGHYLAPQHQWASTGGT